MNHPLITAALLAAICAPSWAINKCTLPDGKVAFQDAPCSGGKGVALTVRPASGDGTLISPAATSSATASEKPKTEAQRLQGLIDESQRDRRKRELVVRLVPDAQFAISRERAQCDQELKALQTKKMSANNNLAGATWETSISSEMTAIATRCDTRNRELRTDFDDLKKECQALGGCK
jgi:chromosome segregation ATPase